MWLVYGFYTDHNATITCVIIGQVHSYDENQENYGPRPLSHVMTMISHSWLWYSYNLYMP